MKKSYSVPEFFRVFPFYEEETIFVENNGTELLFYDDMLEALNLPNRKPWQQSEVYTAEIFHQWKRTKERLNELYAKRDRIAVKPLMIKEISLLIQVIFWSNQVPVPHLNELQENIKELKFKPVNVCERLSFILKEPDHFHSYNQLKALFEETEKLYYKSLVNRKKL
ncbi:hypothetical protein BTR23_00480 [Alkalihalophilus pseudofirmus]|uniref:YpoC family protein n=1 Tax=Alkalihalobacterium alkalinitrilicum TaxID=427920 RepID=UPI00094D5798|nr:hypothetical protein [Alkalihalobacterium alkalinitrilicum]OLO42528.1 hypothetical protein BTR23_00480 [Alkalihalophilus pseudofirmus]